MSMKQLPTETIKLISSTQVITSVSSVVKELMENSIDAQASVIDIRLSEATAPSKSSKIFCAVVKNVDYCVTENYGLDKIEIRDNGTGISHCDVQVMCLQSYTSKITNISDLGKLTSYGFRGEALSSVCAVANVTVITKSESDKYAKSFNMDSNGHVINSSVSHHQKGTVIIIADLFKKLPVRKQIFSSKKHCVSDLRRVENVVKSLTAIQQNLRISLVHNKSVLWQMTPVHDLTLTFGQIWSSSMTKYVKHLKFASDEVKIDIVLPMQNIDVQNCFITTNLADAILLYVNKRPVRDNKIEKLIVAEFSNYFGYYLPSGKYLPCLVSLAVPPETIDVNLEPNKSRVLFHNQEVILSSLKKCINQHYYDNKVEDDIDINITHQSNKRKISFDTEEKLSEKKPLVMMSQINDSFAPSAESTKITNNYLFNPEYCSEEHKQIINELSLEDIDFEEPLTPEENESSSSTRALNEEGKIKSSIDEYKNKLQSIENTIDLDDGNVTNFNTENISISQWSKGGVVLNGKPLECGVSIKSEVLRNTFEVNVQSENKSETHENSELKSCDPVNMYDKIAVNTSANLSNNSIKLAPLFCMVSVPDEQVPGLNHLVNRPQSWEPQPRSKRPIRDTPGEDFSETARSVSSQMGNKDMSGFTLFAKEMRIKILQENPGMDFTEVSKELAKSWNNLSLDEKEKYKNLAVEKKKVVEINKTNKNIIQPPKRAFEFVFKNLKRHSTLINVELLDIKKNIVNSSKVFIPPEFKLIGKVVENGWLCYVRNEIQALNIFNFQEAVIFMQKLANDAIPLKMLDQPIKTSKKFLGENNYHFLIDLDTLYNPLINTYTIRDERIVKNGFNVVIVFNGDNENPDINITDIALHISSYGAHDFKQLLEQMQMENTSNLHCCRPLKVVNYLRSETARHCKTIGLPKTKEEINNLLEYWFKNEELFSHNTCIHHKTVFTSIHTISDG